MASNHCVVCHRALKDPKSIEREMGKVCAAKVGNQLAMEIQDESIATPLSEGVILKRTAHGVATNVPHVVRHHSPTGFEWGYGGSGPADLALNLIELALRQMGYKGATTTDTYKGDKAFKKSFEIYQDFKWEVIAPMERDSQVLAWSVVTEFVQARL